MGSIESGSTSGLDSSASGFLADSDHVVHDDVNDDSGEQDKIQKSVESPECSGILTSLRPYYTCQPYP